MRPDCDRVARELLAPTGALSPGDLAGHLADCPGCASARLDADRLDRIWDATRPADPSPETLDALWARASAALDSPGMVMTLPARRPRRLAVASGLAAGLLIALLIPWLAHPAGPRRVDLVASPPPPPPPSRVTVEVDQRLVFRIGADGHEIERHDEDPAALLVAGLTAHDFFNAAESMLDP